MVNEQGFVLPHPDQKEKEHGAVSNTITPYYK
jgi:hypothetical protein